MKKNIRNIENMIREGKVNIAYGIDDEAFQDTEHDHFVDAAAYSFMALKEMEMTDSYLLLHIRNRPWFMPGFAWVWMLSKVLNLSYFRKND